MKRLPLEREGVGGGMSGVSEPCVSARKLLPVLVAKKVGEL